MNDPASGKSGRSANFAMRQAHRTMAESEKPLVEIVGHMGCPDEKLVKIDHEQFGGPITREELLALADAITEKYDQEADQ